MIWQIVMSLVGGALLVWVVLVACLYVAGRRAAEAPRLIEALRLIPDVLRLMRRLAADPSLPRVVRIELGLLLVYLASPIDLIPDFIPVVGYADDAIVVAIAMRAVARAAGTEAIDRHWPGTAEGLIVIKRVAGLPSEQGPSAK